MSKTQALYFLVNERSMLSLSVTLGQIYSEHAGPNGFLYITYASQEVFGTIDHLSRVDNDVLSNSDENSQNIDKNYHS